MGAPDNPLIVPSRILYTMVRVTDLDRSIAFYRDALGMRELRRETFSDARFTLVFIGYGNETSNAVLELTYNWDTDVYRHGTGYGHIALEVENIYAACKRLENLGVKVTRAPGPMMAAPDETGERETIAFIEDPDGYRIELIAKA
ncbi:MAG: lactoylglutathione lyase [Halopseudomonas aestusnigri]